MNLIIGKNSNVVKSIKPYLFNCHFISHNEISNFDIKKYHQIYIFSWNNNYNQFINLINKLPFSKVIFISTVAIYSNFVRKQWNDYPINKLKVEKFIIEKKGKVLRIGIFENIERKFMSSLLPTTSKDMLVDTINNSNLNQRVTNLFYIKKVPQPSSSFFFKNLHLCSFFVPNNYLFRVPIEILSKYLGSYYYGYTADTLSLFKSEIMIGYGVLGSAYYKVLKNKPYVLCSNLPNIQLSKNGFINTRIGNYLNGLSRFWHGAYIQKIGGNYYRKNSFFLKRPMPPLFSHKYHAEKIFKNNALFEIQTKKKTFFASSLVLAAGPINNSIILSKLYKISAKVHFSDHEIYKIGEINTDEAIQKGYISKFLFLVKRGKLLVDKENTNQALIEMRPFVAGIYENNFDNETKKIFYKIIENFTFNKLNEAIFVKFGIGIYTKKLNLIVQMLNPESITLNTNNFGISKKRLNANSINPLRNILKKLFNSFVQSKYKNSYDGQHIVGGKLILQNKKLIDDIKKQNIKILGSPTKYCLDFRHHTVFLKNKIIEKYKS
ncbi:MAG: hypothetical protein JXQ86_04195 [Methylophilaceae bacterium]